MKNLKAILLAICIAALCVSAAGCKVQPADSSSEAISAVISENTAKNDSVIYNSILEKYSNAIKNVDTALDNPDDDINSELLIAIKSSEGEKFSAYYSFLDINADGVNELLIGAGDGTQPTVIYDILSYNGEKPVHLFDLYSLGYRRILSVYNSGIMRMDGSSGAASNSVAFYKLPSGKTSPELIEEIGTEDGKYYRISADGKRSDSSEEEYDTIEKSHDESKKEIVWNEIKY